MSVPLVGFHCRVVAGFYGGTASKYCQVAGACCVLGGLSRTLDCRAVIITLVWKSRRTRTNRVCLKVLGRCVEIEIGGNQRGMAVFACGYIPFMIEAI